MCSLVILTIYLRTGGNFAPVCRQSTACTLMLSHTCAQPGDDVSSKLTAVCVMCIMCVVAVRLHDGSQDNLTNLSASMFMWVALPATGAAAYIPSLVLGTHTVRHPASPFTRACTHTCTVRHTVCSGTHNVSCARACVCVCVLCRAPPVLSRASRRPVPCRHVLPSQSGRRADHGRSHFTHILSIHLLW